MNETKPKPALTPEEWVEAKSALANKATPEAMVNWLCDADACAAALLQVAGPDGTPLFTREHLEVLRDAAGALDGFLDLNIYTGRSEAEEQQRVALVAEALDRLESLLPPEE